MSTLSNRLVCRRTFTGLTFLSVSIRLEDKQTYISDAVYLEMIGDTGNGHKITMSWSLLKLEAFAGALEMISLAPKHHKRYKEHTQHAGVKKYLEFNYEAEKKELWLNMNSTEGGGRKVGRQIHYFEAKAIVGTIRRMIDAAERELYRMQREKNL